MPPFSGESDFEIMKTVRTGKFDFDDDVWKTVSNDAKDFIKMLLNLDQEARPDAGKAL